MDIIIRPEVIQAVMFTVGWSLFIFLLLRFVVWFLRKSTPSGKT